MLSFFSKIKNLFDGNSLPPQNPEVSHNDFERDQPVIQPEVPVQENPMPATGNGKQFTTWEIGDNILDTFTVLDIKAGGMGRVYIAEHQHRKQKMAIKSLNEKMLADSTLFARVVREAQQWIDLGLHPHIAYCYYVRQINEIPHIFIEYIDGGNLRDWIRSERCQDLKLGLDIAIQFCHGMEYAQEYGMVHRDIKPENILMTANGTLKITDFGLARMTGSDEEGVANAEHGISKQQEQLTMVGQKGVGTAAYMAPEQYLDLRSVDTRADIYSFGVCLYEMFCGCRPFEYESREVPPSILAKYQGHRPVDPRTKGMDIPEKMAALLERCCALDKDSRYLSFSDLRQDLLAIYRNIYSNNPLHAEITHTNLKADGLNNRGVSYWNLGREEDARRCWEEALKEDPQHVAGTFNLGYMLWYKAELGAGDFLDRMRNLESANRIDPDYWLCLAWVYYEQGYVNEIDELQRSPNAIKDEDFLRALEEKDRPIGREVRKFEGHKQFLFVTSVTSVCFSPDGRYVLTGSRDDTARLWVAESGQEVRRFEGHMHKVNSVCFSPDGRYVLTGSGSVDGIIYSKSADNTARLWDEASGLELRRFEGHTWSVTSVCFSPDGRYVLSGSFDKVAHLWDEASGQEVRQFVGHAAPVNTVCFSPDGQYVLTGSIDKTARLWDAESGQEVRRFEGHTKAVYSVCFPPDSRYVLIGSDEAWLWELDWEWEFPLEIMTPG